MMRWSLRQDMLFWSNLRWRKYNFIYKYQIYLIMIPPKIYLCTDTAFRLIGQAIIPAPPQWILFSHGEKGMSMDVRGAFLRPLLLGNPGPNPLGCAESCKLHTRSYIILVSEACITWNSGGPVWCTSSFYCDVSSPQIRVPDMGNYGLRGGYLLTGLAAMLAHDPSSPPPPHLPQKTLTHATRRARRAKWGVRRWRGRWGIGNQVRSGTVNNTVNKVASGGKRPPCCVSLAKGTRGRRPLGGRWGIFRGSSSSFCLKSFPASSSSSGQLTAVRATKNATQSLNRVERREKDRIRQGRMYTGLSPKMVV